MTAFFSNTKSPLKTVLDQKVLGFGDMSMKCSLLRFSVALKCHIVAAGVEKLCRDLQVDPSDRKVRNIMCLPAIAINLVLVDLRILLAWGSFQGSYDCFHCNLHGVRNSYAGSFAGLEDGSTANGVLLQI